MPLAVSDLLSHALSQPKDAIFYTLSASLRQAFPELFLLESEEAAFDVPRFAFEGQCRTIVSERVASQFTTGYRKIEGGRCQNPYNAWHEIEWQGESLQLVTIGVQSQFCREVRHFLLAPNWQVADKFFCAVCKWNSAVRREVMVFHGHWYKDQRLFEDKASTTLDTLVFPTAFKEALIHEFSSFFTSKETYDRYGIAWKRGILLLGAPGNGKTHAIKGLINLVDKPALYVKSFKHQHQTDHQCISEAFKRARETAPCILVLEDLDSLLDDGNRAFFLNEMDGFASNTGILTVATTNHPDRLDPAIMERPSRFDRKYTFDLPDAAMRYEFLKLQNEHLEAEIRLTDEEISLLADRTADFSYAYLKELVLSGLMLWIGKGGSLRLAQLMTEQVETLLQQMRTAPSLPSVNVDGSDEHASRMAAMLQKARSR